MQTLQTVALGKATGRLDDESSLALRATCQTGDAANFRAEFAAYERAGKIDPSVREHNPRAAEDPRECPQVVLDVIFFAERTAQMLDMDPRFSREVRDRVVGDVRARRITCEVMACLAYVHSADVPAPERMYHVELEEVARGLVDGLELAGAVSITRGDDAGRPVALVTGPETRRADDGKRRYAAVLYGAWCATTQQMYWTEQVSAGCRRLFSQPSLLV